MGWVDDVGRRIRMGCAPAQRAGEGNRSRAPSEGAKDNWDWTLRAARTGGWATSVMGKGAPRSISGANGRGEMGVEGGGRISAEGSIEVGRRRQQGNAHRG